MSKKRKIQVTTKVTSWQLAAEQRETKKSLTMKAPYLQTLFSQRNLGGTWYRTTVSPIILSDDRKKSSAPVSADFDESVGGERAPLIGERHECIINVEYLEQVNIF